MLMLVVAGRGGGRKQQSGGASSKGKLESKHQKNHNTTNENKRFKSVDIGAAVKKERKK
jgi:hypothetical protein